MEDATENDCLFRTLEREEREGTRRITVEPTPYAGGPWNPDHQHGGAVSALMARCLDRQTAAAPMRLARMTLEMTRGVPLTPITAETTILRDGRRIQSVEATLKDGDTTVARATGLRIREEPGLAELEASPAPDVEIGAPPTEIPDFSPRPGFEIPGFIRACDMVMTPAPAPGKPGFAWVRLVCRVLDDEATSPLERFAAVADFASGMGNSLDFTRYTSINPDLTLQLLRTPREGWIAVRGVSHRAADGIGQSLATLHDADGPVATVSASQLVDRR